MKRILLVIPMLLLAAGSFADFRYMHSGARPMGMEGAFSAVADDVNALFYNPAGLQAVRHIEALAMYGKLYGGLSDESNLYEGAAAGAFSFPNYGTVALGWTGRGLSDFYQEDAFKVGYGSVWPASWSRATGWKFLSNFSFGLTVNFLQVQLVENDYTRLSSAIARKSNSGISLDAGVLYKNGAWKIAAVAKDMLEPDLTLTTADKNVLPMEMTAGLSYAWPSMGDFLSSMDVAFRENDRKARLGVEKWFWHKKIGCRAGLGYGRDWGADFYSEASLGLSFAFETIANTSGLDYAFLYPLNSGIQNTWGTHFISLSLKW